MIPDSKEMLKKTEEVLNDEGLSGNKRSNDPLTLLDNFIIPGLYNAKNTLASLYKFIPKQRAGFMGKIKNTLMNKSKNLVLNVVERESMRQQKFNDLTYEAIQNLTEEVKQLRSELEKRK